MKKVTIKNTRFSDKWGMLLSGKGYTSLPNELIDHLVDLKMSPSEFLVVVCILKYKWSDEDPYPSTDTLSKLSGLAKNTVRTQVRQLKKRGLINVVPRAGKNNAQQSNGYDFVPLKKILESYAQPTLKRAPPCPHRSSRTYPPPNTEEEAVNKTQEKRHSRISGKPALAADVLSTRYPGIAIKR